MHLEMEFGNGTRLLNGTIKWNTIGNGTHLLSATHLLNKTHLLNGTIY